MDGKVAIVTDTMNCIPVEEIKRWGIREVPLKIIFENKVYQDKIELNAGEFYKMLATARQLPTTAAPSPGHFLEAYRDVSREASRILCITISSKLSATFDSARVAAEMARETLSNVIVEVIDSQTAAAAEGFVVLAAAKTAAAGKKMEEVIAAAKNVMSNVQLVAALDTLKYLVRGGRIPKIAGWAGTLLNIKPIIMLKDGVVHPVGRARSYLAAIKQMMDFSRDRMVKRLPLHMAVMHAGEPKKAEELKSQVSSAFDCAELVVTDFTPVMGVHAGPGIIGLAFYCGE